MVRSDFVLPLNRNSSTVIQKRQQRNSYTHVAILGTNKIITILVLMKKTSALRRDLDHTFKC